VFFSVALWAPQHQPRTQKQSTHRISHSSTSCQLAKVTAGHHGNPAILAQQSVAKPVGDFVGILGQVQGVTLRTSMTTTVRRSSAGGSDGARLSQLERTVARLTSERLTGTSLAGGHSSNVSREKDFQQQVKEQAKEQVLLMVKGFVEVRLQKASQKLGRKLEMTCAECTATAERVAAQTAQVCVFLLALAVRRYW